MEKHITFDVDFAAEGQTKELQTWETEKPVNLDDDDSKDDNQLTVRLDKWLWATRFFKTRALARSAIEKGKVLYNGSNVKASREICLGDKVTLLHGKAEKNIVIVGLSTRRKNADDAQQLYKETQTSRSFSESPAKYTRRSKTANAALPFAPQAMGSAPDGRMVEVRHNKSIRFLRRGNKNSENENVHLINSEY